VTEASNGREALERFREGRFDLVITDYSMPEMRGDELAANVKHLAPSQPVLMLSGTAELLGGLGMPADAFLGKPFTLVDLREAIARLC
jgi:CheY-like chemotaxis protein